MTVAPVVLLVATWATQSGCGRLGYETHADDASGLPDVAPLVCDFDNECDDLDLCDGVETCDLGMHTCANPPDEPDGTPCPSGTCISGVCAAPTCSDGWQNGDETGVDCGGSMCPSCSCSSPSLGATGTMSHPVGSSTDISRAVAIQSDGKIVAAGYVRVGTIYDFAAVRYNNDGSLDRSFDTDGMAVTPLVGDSAAWSVALQADGKILVAGHTRNGANDDFALVRYNTDGSLDSSFDTDGIVITAIGAGHDHGTSVAVQTDGRIVVAGTAARGSVDDFAVVRYHPDGSLDTSLGGAGKVTTPVLANGIAQAVAVQTDGKIVVGGYARNGSSDDLAVVRYPANGTLDNTFGGDGIVTTSVGPLDDQGRSLLIQPDGKIVLVGQTGVGSLNEVVVVRYDQSGNLDSSFATGGVVVTSVLGGSIALSVALQSDAKLIVAGHTWNGSNDKFAVLRYHPNGLLDASFDGDGIVTTSISTSSDFIHGAAVQCDGKIVVVGRSGANIDFTLARYRSDGSLDGP